MKKISIYIHIPFCIRKCLYCDFLSAPAGAEEQEIYLRALLHEMVQESASYANYTVDTVFIGGGTPSVVESKWIVKILCILRECFAFTRHPEITIEMNPKTVTEQKLADYREAGVNRLSIGLQSTDDGELSRLGRIHTYADFLETYQMARKAGFQNINIDLMSALPGQSRESYLLTLKRVLSLQPEHISAYSLIIEEGTPFYERRGDLSLPTEEEDRLMYADTKVLLQEQGYERYEISNYARKGYQCRHNLVYWIRGDYVGFGIGAASLVDNVRWSNVWQIQDYVNQNTKKEQSREILSTTSQMEEFMFLGLRLTEGISRLQFQKLFHRKIEEVYGEALNRHKREGLLFMGNRIRFTDKGMDVADYVLTDFMIEEAK